MRIEIEVTAMRSSVPAQVHALAETTSPALAENAGPVRTLTTPDFSLEPQVAAHAREMFEVLSDPAIYEFENAPPPSEAWLRTRFERFDRLEARGPADSSQRWLNWVIRLNEGRLAGYVQATVLPDHNALVAYELHSRYWRRGIGSRAVQTVLGELRERYAVQTYWAVLKAQNFRSRGLLQKLGFELADDEAAVRYRDEAGEIVMFKPVLGSTA